VKRNADNPALKTISNPVRHGVSRLLFFVLLLLVCPATRTAHAQSSAGEYQVKAAFIFHFAQLVDWPADTFRTPDQPLLLCLADDDPERDEVRTPLAGKLVNGRALQVRLLKDGRDTSGCNIVFLTKHEAHTQASILAGLRGQPVLTVGETNDFLSDGGMIRFRIEQDRIRFEVNLGTADRAHLKISSRLLLLASSVVRGTANSGG
jgi:hypothetical protein